VSLREGPFECVGDPWFLEPDIDALVAALRWVRDRPEETRARGEAASRHAHAGWSWERSAVVAAERLLNVVAPAISRPTAPARLWSEPAVPNRETRRLAARGHIPSMPAPLSVIGRSSPFDVPERPRPSTDGRPLISLCMIVRDEERCLRECLESIRPWVDEM